MDLTVIIVSYNVRYFLGQCISSVLKASENIDCEIFIVDNNSSDGTCYMVTTHFPGINLIRNTENRGFAAANNQAIKLATGRYILLLNPDTIIEEDTFKKCITFMDSHPDAGASGVRMIDGKGCFLPESKRALPTPRTAFFKIFGLSRLFPGSCTFNRYYLSHLDTMNTSQADVLSGAFMFLRKEAVEKAGLLDESFFMYGEDIDYSYRLKKAGYNNYYYPETKIIHFKGESTDKDDPDTLDHFYRAMKIFVMKHFTDGSYKTLIFPIRVAITFRKGLSSIRQSTGKRFSKLKAGLPGSCFKQSSKHHSPYGKKITAVVSDAAGYIKTGLLLSAPGSQFFVAGRVAINGEDKGGEVMGHIDLLRDVINDNGITEVIFTMQGLKVSQIIDSMHDISDMDVNIKIASPDFKYLVGSRHVYAGE